MNKKILSLDLGITSIGYSILEEMDNDRYTLIDYGVSMFDKATDKDGKSKKLLHSASKSSTNLKKLRKERKQNLARLFEKYKFGSATEFLKQEKKNIYIDKWYLRAEKAFTEQLNINEFFTILYLIAKHRGYKSLDTDDLLEDLLIELGFDIEEKKTNKDDEKGQIKKALQGIERLKEESPEKTVARIIYEVEIKKDNPTFRNHDNYNYMIRREYIREEINMLVLSQKEFGLFDDDFDTKIFIKELIETIDDQKDSSNNLSLFGNCEYYPKHKVAHQYSLLSDIFKMYQSVANITFGKTKITKEQIKFIADWFFKKIENGKNISEIKYQDIRTILKLSDEVKIFGKEDYRLDKKGKKVHHTITKFHFFSSLGKVDNTFIKSIFEKENNLEIIQEVFDVLEFEKAPKSIYVKLEEIFLKYDLVTTKRLRDETIISLIKNKSGNSLNISAYAMRQFIPYFEEGLTTDEIKQKLNLERNENYSTFKKGIKYLHINTFEEDDNLEINNHPVKYVVSATIRLVKHLHTTYGAFDEIRVESTRELSQNEETKKAIETANKENEKKFQKIIEDIEYQKIANHYNKNLKRYARKLLLWEEQEKLDIYSGKTISVDDIFSNRVDIDHIIPQSLGGLSVKHNLVLAHRDENVRKSNQLPMNFVVDKKDYENRVEYLFKEYRINWKKKINLLATTLDERYKDTFESKELRATSYIEALTAQMLKRYYPFPDKKKQANGQAVVHIQGRATSNIRKLLKVKTKVRDTNIHHAIDAILIGLTNKSWLQKLSNTFRENMGVIDDEARAKIKKDIPLIEGIEPKELVELIEDAYNIYGEESVFYKDIFGNLKTVNFWVSKKPMSSKMHIDTIYAKKHNNLFTVRTNILNKFKDLKITTKTDVVSFRKKFEKEILHKMYLYATNPNDIICKVVLERADEIELLLTSFVTLDIKNKEIISEAKEKLDLLIKKELKDNNENTIRKIKFYQSGLTGFEIRGGLTTKEKTFIGFLVKNGVNKLSYERIDVANFKKVQKDNDSSFKVYKNDIVFFVFKDNSFRGGKVVSFLSEKVIASFQNSKYPSAIQFQPSIYCIIGKDKEGNPKKTSSKQYKNGKAIGIIKLNLDIQGNIKSYSKFGVVSKEVEDKIFHKE
jgi:CRISPR-associated endonuclease Csn1